MASAEWGTDRPVTDLLLSAGHEFDFFQAVRLLERTSRDRRQVGLTAEPAAEVVRFHAEPSLAFPASAIAKIEKNSAGPPHMVVTFLGLMGCKGALPDYYTELAADELHDGKPALADFLDLFNHRLISLFYRAWEKHHFVVGYERAHGSEGKEDAFTSYLFALIGMGTKGLHQRLAVPDESLLRYAGLLAQRPHSASALASMLRDYFAVPVRVEQFRGVWHMLEEQDLCRLGANRSSSQLGLGTVAGDAVWNCQAQIRVSFGPLHLDDFQEFLPDGTAFRRAASLIQLFTGDGLQFEIQPVLMADEVPSCTLIDSGEGPRLGWSGWLKTQPFEVDAGEAVFGQRELDGIGGAA
jgi:type VI secretion system protein ImpH